jgi:hypothetical protein
MPRTCSTKEQDRRTPAEKLKEIRSIVDKYILFQLYDGMVSNGLVGFDPKLPKGSVYHKRGKPLLDHLTKSQFRGKAEKMAKLAIEFIESNTIPAGESRPNLETQALVDQVLAEIGKASEKSRRDTRPPAEKLDGMTNPIQLFIFFTYYDGAKTEGRIGFSPKSGPPGCINHKRAYRNILGNLTPTTFRYQGVRMAELANKFIESKIIPSESKRPHFARIVPTGLRAGAVQAQEW